MTAPVWAWQQADLFNPDVAELALNEAVERVERNAESEWLESAQKAVRLIAEHREEFTTDSVWAILARWGTPAPHEERAIGAVMRRAKIDGICVPTDKTSRSVRPACNRRDLRVWRSLIVQDSAQNESGVTGCS